MSATRKMEDKGEGKIGNMKTSEKRLVSRGSGNSANDFPDLTGDGKITMADILKGRGVDIAQNQKENLYEGKKESVD